MNDTQMYNLSDIENLGFGDQANNEGRFVADMVKGGTRGIGIKDISLDAATPLVLPPTILVVLAVPQMYAGNEVKSRALKALIEEHPTNVSGIDFGYTIDTAEAQVGHDGQPMLVPIKNKRSTVQPSFTIPEINGMGVWRFFNQWGWDMCHPDTNASFSHLAPEDMVPFVSSSYSMTMCAIQPDPTGDPNNILDGAFYTNMFPTDPGGNIGFERTIGAPATKERSVTFGAHLRHSEKTRDLVKEIYRALGLHNARSGLNRTPTYSEVSDYVANSGIADEIANL